jgi:hypothetical protein
MLFLDGAYIAGFAGGKQIFRRVNAPTKADLEAVLQQLSTRVARMLVKEGVLTQDMENSYLRLDHLEANPLQQVHGHSITYRIAIGPQQGKKVFTLQTLLPKEADDDSFSPVAKAGGFSLHAGVAVQPHERCRYVARPAVSEQRLALTRDGRVRYALKTPYRDGTTHVIFEPLDFIARLAALVPKPRVNPVPRRVRPEQPAPGHHYPGEARQGGTKRNERRVHRARRAHADGATRRHDLGQATETGLQHRHD